MILHLLRNEAIIVPIRILICVTPEENILGKSFLKKIFTLLVIVNFKIESY